MQIENSLYLHSVIELATLVCWLLPSPDVHSYGLVVFPMRRLDCFLKAQLAAAAEAAAAEGFGGYESLPSDSLSGNTTICRSTVKKMQDSQLI
jgi:hypothetical protein